MDTDQPLPCRVLLIEDNEETRYALARILDGAGYEVACAAEGREALDVLRCEPRPDVIILDLLLPGMDGWEFLRHTRDDPGLARIPVIVITAILNHPSPLGAAAALAKPLDIRELLEAIDRCRRQRQHEVLHGRG